MTYNRQNVTNPLEDALKYIRGKLKNILKETMAYVMVDGVIHFSRSFLGINVQVS